MTRARVPRDTAVVGSRGFGDYVLLCATLDELAISRIVTGDARGADALARRYATERGIPLEVVRADWDSHKGAGLARNPDIVARAEVVVAFWDGESPGTRNTLDHAERECRETFVVRYLDPPPIVPEHRLPPRKITSFFSARAKDAAPAVPDMASAQVTTAQKHERASVGLKTAVQRYLAPWTTARVPYLRAAPPTATPPDSTAGERLDFEHVSGAAAPPAFFETCFSDAVIESQPDPHLRRHGTESLPSASPFKKEWKATPAWAEHKPKKKYGGDTVHVSQMYVLGQLTRDGLRDADNVYSDANAAAAHALRHVPMGAKKFGIVHNGTLTYEYRKSTSINLVVALLTTDRAMSANTRRIVRSEEAYLAALEGARKMDDVADALLLALHRATEDYIEAVRERARYQCAVAKHAEAVRKQQRKQARLGAAAVPDAVAPVTTVTTAGAKKALSWAKLEEWWPPAVAELHAAGASVRVLGVDIGLINFAACHLEVLDVRWHRAVPDGAAPGGGTASEYVPRPVFRVLHWGLLNVLHNDMMPNARCHAMAGADAREHFLYTSPGAAASAAMRWTADEVLRDGVLGAGAQLPLVTRTGIGHPSVSTPPQRPRKNTVLGTPKKPRTPKAAATRVRWPDAARTSVAAPLPEPREDDTDETAELARPQKRARDKDETRPAKAAKRRKGDTGSVIVID